MFLLSKTCYSLLAFARFEWLLSVLFCFRWNYSVSHFYDVSKKPSLLRFSVISLLDFFVYRSRILIRSLFPHHPPRTYSKMLAILFTLEFFLSISFVFLSIVSRFLCNFLDVMQFSRCNSIASLFGNFFEHLLRSFSHVFLYAPSLAHWFSSNFLKNACNIFLKVEPSKLNSSLFSP